jgi:hypothetical protein
MTPVSSNVQYNETNTVLPSTDTGASKTATRVQRFIVPEDKGLNSSMFFQSVTNLETGEITHTDTHKAAGVTKYREFLLVLPSNEEKISGSAIDESSIDESSNEGLLSFAEIISRYDKTASHPLKTQEN